MDISVLGIDLAKNIMQLHGVDARGKVVVRKSFTRKQMIKYIAVLKPCLIGMEACGGSNYWARKLQEFGHEVKLMSPQFVKPYVKSNKNDFNDAEAICEAVTRPTMRFVPIKLVEQQDIQSLHRIRTQILKTRTALTNQIRGLLAEYGVIIPLQIQNVRNKLPEIIEDAENELSDFSRKLFANLYEDLVAIDERIARCDREIKTIYRSNDRCKKISEIEGVGPITATAIISVLTNTKLFKSGREFAAWLGLVPRQNSSGGKQNLLGISKRGDTYIRTLLIHGARAVVGRSINKSDRRSEWINNLKERGGFNKTAVALANKNARIIWAVLDSGQAYRSAA